MHFSQEDIKRLQRESAEIATKCQRLMEAYLARNYKNPRAEEYAAQGFLRRLKMLVRCIDRVFEIFPPDRIDVPTNDELSDATINLQAFVFNVVGCADNLAWIWVSETGLKNDDGSDIKKGQIGLGQKHQIIRDSFSAGFQAYLKGLDGWFGHIENFRHALAHRIPLYIPPYVVPDSHGAAYQEYEDRMTEAIKGHKFEEHERLSAEQTALVYFLPVMTHSFKEKAKFVVFHPQLLADFYTIEELGEKMLLELNR